MSYAGRVHLINNVLFSFKHSGSKYLFCPKKIIQVTEATCRRFLWTGGTDRSKRALLAWEKVYYPKSAGGINILDILTRNRTAICKLLRNLCKKKDPLWVQSVHVYYGNSRLIWKVEPIQTS